MEYIRVFNSAADAEQQLAQITHPTLSAIRGESGISLNPGAPDPSMTPFYVENVNNNDITIQIKQNKNYYANYPVSVDKSIDGITWEYWGSTSPTAISVTVPAKSKLYLRGLPSDSACRWSYDFSAYTFFQSNGQFNIGGNIMSLLYGDSFDGQTVLPNNSYSFTFGMLFYNCANLLNAKDLILPTNVCDSVYNYMFNGCTSLITAPALPATTLVQNCYSSMFNGCTSLITAPELPATTLANKCYGYMFKGCTNLNYIKCLATNISASKSLTDWVSGVAATGTFVKDASMTGWPTGTAGIPSGWTVQDAA